MTVAEDDTVLDAVNRAGAAVLSTCREGTCGTCEVRVLDGVPEHRDSVLGLEERLAGRDDDDLRVPLPRAAAGPRPVTAQAVS